MSRNFTVELSNTLVPVAKSEWDYLFAGSPNTYETIRLVQQVGVEEFTFHSILVRIDGRASLLLPVFETNHYLGSTLEGSIRRAADAIDRVAPSLLRMRLARVGIVDQQWGEVGYDRQCDRDSLDRAWAMALDTLESLCRARKVQLVAFTEFTPETGSLLPLHRMQDFHIAPGAPFIQIPVAFPSVDAYLASLPKDMRHFLRRSLRKAASVTTVRTRDIEPWLDAIYDLYLGQVARSELNLNGTQRKAYFEQACRMDPSAEYFLYLLDDRLIGFELVCHLPDCLLSKFVAIDPVFGRAHNLYFRSWMELVSECIERSIPTIDLGCTGETQKTRLGDARIIPSFVLFKHRNPLLNRLLARFKSELAYDSAVPVPEAAVGLGWSSLAGGADSRAAESLDPGAEPIEDRRAENVPCAAATPD